MAREWLTDEEVEMEIEKLRGDKNVQLARKELRLKYKRRQALYVLRNLAKRGQELSKTGITYDNIEEKMFSDLGDIES